MFQSFVVKDFAGQHSCAQIMETLFVQGFQPQYNSCNNTNWSQTKLRGAVVDSREASPGLLFVARRGQQRNGHDYIAAAYKNGCRHFLVERNYDIVAVGQKLAADATFISVALSTEEALLALARSYRQSLKNLYVLAISGSYGKTSTKELLGCMLSQHYRCQLTADNRNAPIGCALTILAIAPDTELAVLELGIDRPGEMDLLCSLAQPNAALLTGIGSAHLGGFGSQEQLARQKARIYAHLLPFGPTDGKKKKMPPLALLPADDTFISILRAEVLGKEVFFSAKLARQQGYDVQDRGLAGLRFTFSPKDAPKNFSISNDLLQNVPLSCELPLLGLHNQQVFWAAAAASLCLGLHTEQIFAGAKNYRPLFGRGQLLAKKLKSGGRINLLQDCYNASPESVYALLEMLNSWERQGILPTCVLILGDMLELGAASAECHRKVAHLLLHFWSKPRKAKPALQCVWLYGPQMAEAQTLLREQLLLCEYGCHYCNDAAQLERGLAATMANVADDLTAPTVPTISQGAPAANTQQPLLVLKGARSMYLEKIAEKILL